MPTNDKVVITLPRAQFCSSKSRKRLNAAVLAALLFAPEVYAANTGGQLVGNDYKGVPPNYTVTIDSDVDGSVYGRYETGAGATGASVTMSGGTVSGNVYGRYERGADATGASVTMSGGDVSGNVYGGHAAGFTDAATDNTVSISGNAYVSGNVYGGYAAGGAAKENTVTIDGGTFNLMGFPGVYGGYSAGSNATDNTVTLGANLGANALQNVSLYGGYINPGDPHDAVTGNILNVYAKGLTVLSVENFEYWNFILPADTRANDTILTVTEAVDMTAGGKVPKPQGGVAMAGGGKLLKKGDRVTLIHSDKGVKSGGYDGQQTTGTAFQGVSVEYKFKVESDANNLYAEVTAPDTPTPPGPNPPPPPPANQTSQTNQSASGAPPASTSGGGSSSAAPAAARASAQSQAVVEGRAAHGAKIAQQGNLVSQGAITSALNAARDAGNSTQTAGIAPFAAAEASYERLETGSHVELTGGSAVAGLGKRFGGERLEALAGAFLEFGASHHKTFNDNAGFEQHGKGDASFIGGGLLGRLETAGGFYTEASLRLGRMDADWNGNFLWAGRPWHDGYDADTPYYGAHAGLGCIMPLAESLNLDLYARYLWSRLEGDDTALIRMRDPYILDDVDSHRLRLGFTLTRSFSERLSGYAGGAWEHEFDGDAHALTYQILDVPSASFGGDTGVLDAGVVWQTGPFSTRAGLSGYLGTRRGVSGNVMLRYEF